MSRPQQVKRKVTIQKQKGVDTPEPAKNKDIKEVKGKAKDPTSNQKEDDTLMETPVGKARRKGDEGSDNGGTGEEPASGEDEVGEIKEQSAVQDDASKQKLEIQTGEKQEGKVSDIPLEAEKSPEIGDAKKCCKCTQGNCMKCKCYKEGRFCQATCTATCANRTFSKNMVVETDEALIGPKGKNRRLSKGGGRFNKTGEVVGEDGPRHQEHYYRTTIQPEGAEGATGESNQD